MAGELVGLAGGGEDDDGDLGVAENGQLISFLQNAIPTFREAHLPTCRIFNSLHLNFASSHFFFFFIIIFLLQK